jgi:hypothetical protein
MTVDKETMGIVIVENMPGVKSCLSLADRNNPAKLFYSTGPQQGQPGTNGLADYNGVSRQMLAKDFHISLYIGRC